MAGARVLSAGRASQPDARGGGQTDASEAALGTVPGPLHPGGHSAAGLSLSLWPRMCTGLEQHQDSDDGNEERNRNAYGHSRAGRHPECGRAPAGSAPGSGTGAGGGQRPAPPTPALRGDLAQRPLSALGLSLTRPPRPGRGRSPACCRALGAMASRDWAALLHGPGWEARRPPIAVTLPSLTRVLGGGPVSDGARAHVQMRLSAVLKKERVWGAPPRPLPQCWRTLLI